MKRAMAQAVVTGSIQNTQSEVKAHESIPDFADAHFTSELKVDLVEPVDVPGVQAGDTIKITYWHAATRPAGWVGNSGTAPDGGCY